MNYGGYCPVRDSSVFETGCEECAMRSVCKNIKDELEEDYFEREYNE